MFYFLFNFPFSCFLFFRQKKSFTKTEEIRGVKSYITLYTIVCFITPANHCKPSRQNIWVHYINTVSKRRVFTVIPEDT